MKKEYTKILLDYLSKNSSNMSKEEKEYFIKKAFSYEFNNYDNNNKSYITTVEEDIDILINYCYNLPSSPLINERIKKLSILKLVVENFKTSSMINFVSQELDKIRLDLDLDFKVYKRK